MPYYNWRDEVTGDEVSVSRKIADRGEEPTPAEVLAHYLALGEVIPAEPRWIRTIDVPNVQRVSFIDGTKRPAFEQHKASRAIERAAAGESVTAQEEAKREAKKVKTMDTGRFK